MRNKLKVEEIVSIRTFKSIWFAWNNEANHKEAEDIYEEFQLDIQYKISELFHSFYAKKNNNRTFQELVDLKKKLRSI